MKEKFSQIIFYSACAIVGTISALIAHELHYGIIRNFLKAPPGKVWISSGGPHSDYSIWPFIILSIFIGSFANYLLLPVVFSNLPGNERKYYKEDLGCWPMVISYFSILIVLYFLGHYGKPFFM